MATSLVDLQSALGERYRLDRELGRGGMATVYLAHDLRLGRDVAVKVLHPELGAALGSERFRREVDIAARLSHPHILPIEDFGGADGVLYYVMPYVAGETLAARLRTSASRTRSADRTPSGGCRRRASRSARPST